MALQLEGFFYTIDNFAYSIHGHEVRIYTIDNFAYSIRSMKYTRT
jgi:hypothetical protein